MKIEHIISTMNRSEFSFLENLNLKTSCLVVNQNQNEEEKQYQLKGVEARILCTPETGLSRSRNKLLQNAVGDICIICDDDVEYLPGYLAEIETAYKSLPDADIIAFRFTHEKGKETRAKYSKIKRLRLWNISKVASVEITFKRKSIINAGINFNNNLGLGAKFPSGEENAFLADALRAGLKIYYYPKTICLAVEAHCLQSSEETKQYLLTKGAAFYCIYRKWFLLFAIGFIILKKRILFKETPLYTAYKWMVEGKKQYKQTEEAK